ncbi:MAG: OmpA family protein [Myxococcaceae bacterium]|jgi:chemotaxis protein MotB|nr:OmpA family protein [Myxococcaceae bacterium]MCA3011997.1 OmpA family protein [Myxococcaceae bacterium]
MRRSRSAGEESWLLSYADLITNLLLFFVVLLTAANLSKGRMQQIAKSLSGAEAPQSLESLRKELDQRIAAQSLKELVSTTVTNDGLEMSLNSGLVFDSGKAVIRPELEPVVVSMLETLQPYGAKYSFAVEGHTDANPVAAGGAFSSNWDLAAERAIVVRERLEGVGVPRNRIRVEGYADTKPLPEAELQGLSPEQRNARLRRVVVRIY